MADSPTVTVKWISGTNNEEEEKLLFNEDNENSDSEAEFKESQECVPLKRQRKGTVSTTLDVVPRLQMGYESYKERCLNCIPEKCRRYIKPFYIILVVTVLFLLVVLIGLLIARALQKMGRGAVATDVPECSEMAARILQRRGSAVDAAITAMLCVGVYHPESSGIGGGGFMIVHDPNGNIWGIDFRETAPMKSSKEDWAEKGGLAVAVPGELRGLEMAHSLGGKLNWSTLFDAVIDRAYNGFKVTPHLARVLSGVASDFANSTIFNDTYMVNGQLANAGDTISNKPLAKTLLKLRDRGASALYEGELAEEIVTLVQNNSGVMNLDDLKKYKARSVKPIFTDFNDYKAYSLPAPSGGPLLLYILNILSGYSYNSSLIKDGYPRKLPTHRMVEAFKFAFAAREHLGDVSCSKCENASILELQHKLINATFGSSTRSQIKDDKTQPIRYYTKFFDGGGGASSSDSGTSHIAVLSPEGQAVSVITTVNQYFGAKLITPSGIVLNNEMADFSLHNKTNYIAPGRRPLSSQSPIIVVKSNSTGSYPILVTGASGGKHIITGTAQCVLNNLLYQLSLPDSIENRRLHHQLRPNVLDYESDFPEDLVAYLRDEIGDDMKECNITSCAYSVVQGVSYDPQANSISAHSDSRKQGKATLVKILE